MAKKPMNFEQAIETLDGIVNRMNSGELALDESLKQFEQGITLIRECQQTLAKAEQKVQQLMQDDNGLHMIDWDEATNRE